MQPDLENLETRIDRDRRKREEELLLLLLLLMRRTRQYGDAALKVGSDPFGAMSAVMMGSALLGLPGGSAGVAALLLLADRTGYRRTQLVIPGDTVYRPSDYRSTASIALAQMWSSLQHRIAQGMATAQRGVRGVRAALRDAFRSGGYTEANPWRVRTAAETLVGTAYNAGYYAGFQRPEAREAIEGFRYSSILDDVTTPICRAYADVRLPQDHPWWLTHWPMNHWGCRGMVLPIFGDFEVTENPPLVPPPMAGFGRAPFALYRSMGAAA